MVFDIAAFSENTAVERTSVPNFGWRPRGAAVHVGALPKPCKNRNPEIILFTSFGKGW
jgi:hypothetical protein